MITTPLLEQKHYLNKLVVLSLVNPGALIKITLRKMDDNVIKPTLKTTDNCQILSEMHTLEPFASAN